MLYVCVYACVWYQLGSVSEILLNEFGADYSQERGGGLIGYRLRKQCLAGARLAVEHHT